MSTLQVGVEILEAIQEVGQEESWKRLKYQLAPYSNGTVVYHEYEMINKHVH